MFAMQLNAHHTPLVGIELPDPEPGPDEIRIRIGACGVCRTDLHVVDGELPHAKLPIIPGHEIVGRIDKLGSNVKGLSLGERVGVPWLGHTCGHCYYCTHGMENLCDHPLFTGFTKNGGYATMTVADARYAFPMGDKGEDKDLAPLLCAGLIGWRCLKKAGDGKKIGLYGFGAAAHIIIQVLRWQGREVYAFTSPGDTQKQDFARSLGATWAGGSDELPPEELDAVILFAPVGPLVPAGLKAIRKGGRVVCGGIHMSPIPSFSYDILWEEREIVSVANLTRADGLEFLKLAPEVGIKVTNTPYPLKNANKALDDLRHGRFDGAAVLIP
ncbi:zinc-dependent alcohol dehydrogenase family protein [Gluconobacter morbifer]|uniref:alcohol dehydrogenase n=1 Tax=Gluconobacter morbifer G707 TaxID=1088869 RepID=G6XLF1_9PROT|nr:zinc-dependent alcohol dehydrogenase family protein [Gluconobacter morbifer]EHH67206.1 alcohol dehydrogenase-like oxidoreductase protein [Gluconobacter morbifer G707]